MMVGVSRCRKLFTPLRQSWSKKGMRSRRYQSWTQRAARDVSCAHNLLDLGFTYDLELNRDDPKVQHLDGRPDKEVGLEGWDVHVLEFASQGPSTSTFCDCHEREETRQTLAKRVSNEQHDDFICAVGIRTKRRKEELVSRNPFQSRYSRILLGERECSRQKPKPLELNGRH